VPLNTTKPLAGSLPEDAKGFFVLALIQKKPRDNAAGQRDAVCNTYNMGGAWGGIGAPRNERTLPSKGVPFFGGGYPGGDRVVTGRCSGVKCVKTKKPPGGEPSGFYN
jgi:hypothetical protein